jgi:hypothetical protein
MGIAWLLLLHPAKLRALAVLHATACRVSLLRAGHGACDEHLQVHEQQSTLQGRATQAGWICYDARHGAHK